MVFMMFLWQGAFVRFQGCFLGVASFWILEFWGGGFYRPVWPSTQLFAACIVPATRLLSPPRVPSSRESFGAAGTALFLSMVRSPGHTSLQAIVFVFSRRSCLPDDMGVC